MDPSNSRKTENEKPVQVQRSDQVPDKNAWDEILKKASSIFDNRKTDHFDILEYTKQNNPRK